MRVCVCGMRVCFVSVYVLSGYVCLLCEGMFMCISLVCGVCVCSKSG